MEAQLLPKGLCTEPCAAAQCSAVQSSLLPHGEGVKGRQEARRSLAHIMKSGPSRELKSRERRLGPLGMSRTPTSWALYSGPCAAGTACATCRVPNTLVESRSGKDGANRMRLLLLAGHNPAWSHCPALPPDHQHPHARRYPCPPQPTCRPALTAAAFSRAFAAKLSGWFQRCTSGGPVSRATFELLTHTAAQSPAAALELRQSSSAEINCLQGGGGGKAGRARAGDAVWGQQGS